MIMESIMIMMNSQARGTRLDPEIEPREVQPMKIRNKLKNMIG
jgi:hypothetical protein